jgi:HlyD family secretion protein
VRYGEPLAVQQRDERRQYEQVGTEQQLVAKNLSPRAKLLELQREQADIEGKRSQNRAGIARAHQSMAEAQLRIGELRTESVDMAVKQLGEVQGTLLDLSERLRAAEDVNRRIEVRAPTAGTVVNLKVHSTGGVVAPGDPMMELVPAMDRLIVEARVEPHDADVVHVGLNSQVRLTAYNQRHALPLEGHVTHVSADRLTDERTGQHYYEARVELNENAIVGDRTIYPGMPAEVIIVTAAHTLADYLLEPLSGVFRRSLREKQ